MGAAYQGGIERPSLFLLAASAAESWHVLVFQFVYALLAGQVGGLDACRGADMKAGQQGAVLVEACLVAIALILIIFSGRYLMGLQHTLQRLQQSSHAHVFVYDENAVLPPLNYPAGSTLQPAASSASVAHPTPLLMSELLGLNGSFDHVRSHFFVRGSRWWRQDLTLIRQSLLLAKAEPADDPAWARKRLAASPSAWKNATQFSHAAAQRTRQAAGSLDSAWGRALPDLDWLSSWEQVVPDADQGREQ